MLQTPPDAQHRRCLAAERYIIVYVEHAYGECMRTTHTHTLFLSHCAHMWCMEHSRSRFGVCRLWPSGDRAYGLGLAVCVLCHDGSCTQVSPPCRRAVTISAHHSTIERRYGKLFAHALAPKRKAQHIQHQHHQITIKARVCFSKELASRQTYTTTHHKRRTNNDPHIISIDRHNNLWKPKFA